MTKKEQDEVALAQPHGYIEVLGARVHNLKNLDVRIPKNQLVVITGISGSGKSSLAFDTIFAEGQRRYMESFAAYARQFMGDLDRPDVDKVTGLSPVISIEQKTTNRNPRSTVGTVTEVYDFMRLLYARVGEAFSYNTGEKMARFSEDEIVAHIRENFSGKRIILLAPIVRGRKGHYRELFEQLRKQGYLKVRVDGEVADLKERMQVDRYKIHDIELVVDRLAVQDDASARLSGSVQQSLQLGKELMFVLDADTDKITQYSKTLMCADTGLSYEEPSPNTFSFNSPYGACPRCKGLGSVYQVNMDEVIPDTDKSIKDGAIVPLGAERESWTYQQAIAIARKHKISITEPFNKLKEAQRNIILYGNEEGVITYEPDDAGSYPSQITQYDYEGVINILLRYFAETTSENIREWAEGFMMLQKCPTCEGARLKKESLWFKLDQKNISDLSQQSLQGLMDWFENLEDRLSKKQNVIAKDIVKEIRDRLHFLLDVGLHYLTLDRSTRTLSGGESQRIRLATQIGSQLTGITYILDEPSIGLHQRDNQRLINALKNLRDSGNSVLVVEHDKDIMLAADHLIDVGPAAGWHGGRIVSQGTPEEMLQMDTTTAGYLNNTLRIEVPAERRKGNGKKLVLKGVTGNNLKGVSISLPLGTFIAVSGVSGSGKSTLINETLYPLLSRHCYDSKMSPLEYKSIKGLEHIDKVIEIDQSPIGRTPRSNPATYCGFFTEIRQLFAQVPEAKIRGYNAGRFSFNVKGGRCEECGGGGLKTIEMNFLPDVYVPCDKCLGRRYNRETLEIRYKGKSIADVLEMTVSDAVEFFINVPWLHRRIKALEDVGLGYVQLGQNAVTLSGGEAQRVKLATELGKRDTGQTIYILDEPTTGLHFQDISHLLVVLNRLVDRGNTVLVVEHNLDVIKVADYVIDMGPEGGSGGGTVVASGTPEDIAAVIGSHTGLYLKEELKPFVNKKKKRA